MTILTTTVVVTHQTKMTTHSISKIPKKDKEILQLKCKSQKRRRNRSDWRNFTTSTRYSLIIISGLRLVQGEIQSDIADIVG
jgi:hypothetical protein